MNFPEPGKRMRILLPLCALIWSMTMGSASAAFKHLHEGMVPEAIKAQDVTSAEQVKWKPGSVEDQVTLVVFWATWSPRSLEILADLKEVQARYQDDGLQVYAFNVDSQSPSPLLQKQVKQMVTELALPFPTMIDEDLKLFYAYGVIAVPSMALFDQDGILQYGPSGYSFVIRDRLDDRIGQLLGLAPPTDIIAAAPVYQAPKKATRYLNLALKMHGKGMLARALSNVELAVAADTMYSAPHGLRGQILLAQEEWAAAAVTFEHAVSLDSTIVSAWAGWGRAKLGLEDDKAAQRILNWARTLDDTYTPALLDLAVLAERAGDESGAAELVRSALALNPRDGEALLMMARISQKAGDLAAATAAFRQAVEQVVTLPVLAPADAAVE